MIHNELDSREWWEKGLKHAIYRREVAAICLNCPRDVCPFTERGCPEYRAAMKAYKHPAYAHVGRKKKHHD